MGILSVVNKKKHIPTERDVYIGRPSAYGNPFELEEYGFDRDVVLELYLDHFLQQLPLMHKYLRPFIEGQGDANLVCSCAPLKCHGDILKEYVDYCRVCPPSKNTVIGFRELKGFKNIPLTEGVDHINVYSKSKTEVGKLLSNFAHTPFELDGAGQFASIEAYWYWLKTGSKHEQLRNLHGFKAKEIGQKLDPEYVDGFDDFIDKAIEAKIMQNPSILTMLQTCTLPFMHYYTYGKGEDALIRNATSRFIRGINEVRSKIQGGLPTVIAGSRSVKSLELVSKAILNSGMKISQVISGKAKGVDVLGYAWAKRYSVPISSHPVSREEWQANPKGAGFIRNARMEKVAKQGIIIIENNSSGSEHMLNIMTKANKNCYVIRI